MVDHTIPGCYVDYFLPYGQAFKLRNDFFDAADKLMAALEKNFEIRKCGTDTPCALSGRVNDGRTENIHIEFGTSSTTIGWKEFPLKPNAFENY